MGSQTLVGTNEYVGKVEFPKDIQLLFNLFAIGFGQRQSLDSSRSQPLDKFIFPILDKRARAHYNDSLGSRSLVGSDPRLEQSVNESDRLKGLSEAYVKTSRGYGRQR